VRFDLTRGWTLFLTVKHAKSTNPHINNIIEKTIIIVSMFPQPLFVAVDMPRLYAERGVSGHPALKLVDAQDSYCRWMVAYWRKALRDEAEGLPVPVRKPNIHFKKYKYNDLFDPRVSLSFTLVKAARN